MNKLLQKSFVAFAASVFLMACGDDSSDSFGGGAKEDYCKVVQKDPLVIEAVEDGFFSKTTFEYDDGEITETFEFKSHDAVELACSNYKKDYDYKSVECNDKSIVAVGRESFSSSEFKQMMSVFVSACEEVNEDKTSSSSANSSSSATSSSSSKRTSGSDYCEILSQDPFVIEMVSESMYNKMTIEFNGGNFIQTMELDMDDADFFDMVCSDYKKDSDYSSVTCEGNTIVTIDAQKHPMEEYNQVTGYLTNICDNINQASNSSSSENSSSSAKSSSSVASSSSSAKSSSSVASSSSSAKSSSSVAPSSSSVNSSSSSVGNDEVMSAMYVQYWNSNVVALNADDLGDCEESSLPADMSQYEIAYEFNDPYDLGADYIGEKTNAYLDLQVSGVSADCGSIVLDGTNGLIVPKNDIFKSKGFVIEVRFMATAEGDLSNLFVADPPGSGVDGWQLRLDGSTANFHIRDGSFGWQVFDAGKVTLNKWHVFRVKLFPYRSDKGSINYDLNVFLDGSGWEPHFDVDVSDFDFDVGIGYDAVYQGEHERRTFKGKIDYIRYGRITEDGL